MFGLAQSLLEIDHSKITKIRQLSSKPFTAESLLAEVTYAMPGIFPPQDASGSQFHVLGIVQPATPSPAQ